MRARAQIIKQILFLLTTAFFLSSCLFQSHDSSLDNGFHPGVSVATGPALPANASSLSWAEGASTANLTINANWTPSVATDLQNQFIQFYAGNCAALLGSSINLGSVATAAKSFVGENGQSYSFKITSVYQAGNSQTSSCSPVITESPIFTDNSYSTTTPSFANGVQLATTWATDKLVLNANGSPTNNS